MQYPLEINNRKYRAHTQLMKITYFKLHGNQIDFRVGVIGSRKIPYILDFSQSTLNITCTCPDYENRQHKPICKHMLFIVNLSNQKAIFNNLMLHNDLKDVAKLETIRLSLMNIIDAKKMGSELSESNVVSIERDDYCSICMCDLDGQIEKCSICAHVMHDICIQSWWNLSSSWNSIKGSCPYCKSKGFTHIKQKDEDPWRLFDFSDAASAAPGTASEAPGTASEAPGAASEAPGAASEAPIADFFPEVELQDQHESLFGPIPDQDPIENLRIQLDQELEIREEIISEISVLRIETESQRRLIEQLESQENDRQIIQYLLQDLSRN